MATEIIKRVQVTEKGTRLAAENKYFLEVLRSATKPQIRQVVEAKYGVHVLSVHTQNFKGETKMIRGTRLTRVEPTWKRAIVTVKAGERIENV